MPRHKGWRWKGVVEVVHDDCGFDDDIAVVDERRHDAVRVKLEICRVELIAVQGHQAAFPFQPLFCQGQPRLLGADRCGPVIEFKHHFLPVSMCRDCAAAAD
jgi:hypothetical protein